jgi:hypothetical protein
MRFEIEARASGEKVTIEYLDWLHLLNLAIRYDWGDMADLEHYLRSLRMAHSSSERLDG